MSGHTKEPWRVKHAEHGSNCFYVVDSDATSAVARVTNYKMQGVGEANARRIMACVNACEGIDTELIEPRMLGDQIAAKMAVIDKCERLNTENAALNDYCAAVEQQRDRLLEAVRGLLDALPSATTHPAIATARSAIAEVEGNDHEPI